MSRYKLVLVGLRGGRDNEASLSLSLASTVTSSNDVINLSSLMHNIRSDLTAPPDSLEYSRA